MEPTNIIPHAATQNSSASHDAGLPMPYSTYNGGVSWLGVGLLVLTATSLTLTIISAYHNIQVARANLHKTEHQDKEILEIKKRLGMLTA